MNKSGSEQLREFHKEMNALLEEKPKSEVLNLLVDIATELEAIDMRIECDEEARKSLNSISTTLNEFCFGKRPKLPYNMYGLLVGTMKTSKRLSKNTVDALDREYFKGKFELAKDLLEEYF